MKRIFSICLVVLALLGTMLLISCTPPAEEAEPPHVHSFESTKVPATCIDTGYTEHVCEECGYVMRDSFVEPNAKFHKYDVIERVEPTCHDKGYEIKSCSICHDQQEPKVLDIKHTFGETVVLTEPDCDSYGLSRKTCELCPYYEDIVLNPKHDYDKETGVVTEPTCSTVGYTTYQCKICNIYVDDDFIASLPHVFGEWTESDASHCQYQGHEVRKCENCDYEEYRILDFGDHQYDVVVTPPTCTEVGYSTYSCKYCDVVVVDDYVLPQHTFGEWQNYAAPDCLNNGMDIRVCASCGYEEARILDPQHVFTVVVTDPKCTEDGSENSVCDVCGHTETVVLPATGHSYSDWVHISDPTCKVTGLEQRTCSVCDHVDDKILDITDEHVFVTHTVIDPTATTTGYTEHVCDCGERVYKTDFVAATESEGLNFILDTRWDYELGQDVEFYRVNASGESVDNILVIPGTQNGVKVEIIGHLLFENADQITTVAISKDVRRILTYSFWKFMNLEEIVFDGTMAEWEALDKLEGWDNSFGDYIVSCSDGVITVVVEK